MKIGVFDSGLGGLVIAKAIRDVLPDYDMLYLGDTLHVPYGNRSCDTIYDYSQKAVAFLFEQGCSLVIVACNTVSATALRPLQQHYLPSSIYYDRRILGVVVPTLEYAIDHGTKRLGIIGTRHTIESHIYQMELQKIDPGIQIFQKATPLLVPLIENDGMRWVDDVLESYLTPLLSHDIESLILGCTHYAFLKNRIQNIVGTNVKVMSQDDIIPPKLKDYLGRHSERASTLSKKGAIDFMATDLTDAYHIAAEKIYGQNIHIRKVTL